MLSNIGGAATVGVGAAVIAFWKQFQALVFRITGIIIARHQFQGTAGLAVRHYLKTEAKWELNLGSTTYRSSVALTSRRRRFEYIAFEMLNDAGAIYLCRYGVVLATDQSQSFDSADVQVVSLRGFFKMKKFLYDAVAAYNRSTYEVPKRFCLMKRHGAGSVHARTLAPDNGPTTETASSLSVQNVGDISAYAAAEALRRGSLKLVTHDVSEIMDTADLGGGESQDPFHGLFYSPLVMRHVDSVRHWLDDRDWYESRSLPWRLGWLLYGPPGTGKTRLVVAVAQKYDLPIFFFDLASMSNSEFEEHWKHAQAMAPCMVVFEDFCRTFKGEKNLIGEEGGGLALTTILNCLSGGETAHGIFTVVTANDVGNVSEAIGQPTEGKGSSRPGRTDKAVKLDKMAPQEKEALVRFMLDGLPDKSLKQVFAQTHDMTAAQVANVCVEMARAWKAENEKSIEAGRVEEPGAEAHLAATSG